MSRDYIDAENEVLRGLLRRAQRHLLALGESDRDAGHRDASLVALLRDMHEAGVYGGASLAKLADRIDEAAFKPPKPRKQGDS